MDAGFDPGQIIKHSRLINLRAFLDAMRHQGPASPVQGRLRQPCGAHVGRQRAAAGQAGQLVGTGPILQLRRPCMQLVRRHVLGIGHHAGQIARIGVTGLPQLHRQWVIHLDLFAQLFQVAKLHAKQRFGHAVAQKGFAGLLAAQCRQLRHCFIEIHDRSISGELPGPILAPFAGIEKTDQARRFGIHPDFCALHHLPVVFRPGHRHNRPTVAIDAVANPALHFPPHGTLTMRQSSQSRLSILRFGTCPAVCPARHEARQFCG